MSNMRMDTGCSADLRRDDDRLVLVISCRGCDRGKGTLNDGTCFRGAVEALASGTVPDLIVMSGRNETQYFGQSVKMIAKVAALKRDLARLATRGPLKRGGCKGCSADPGPLFTALLRGLDKGVGPFYDELVALTKKVESVTPEKDCGECHSNTMDDLHFVIVNYREFVRFILKEGFSVVL